MARKQRTSNPAVIRSLANLLIAAKDHTESMINAGLVSTDQLKYVFADRQARAKAAKQLADEGMSTRKIAALTGVHHSTIEADLAGGNPPKSGGNPPPKKKAKVAKMDCDFDYEHDKEDEEEPDDVTRAHAFTWQTREAIRLAKENALLRRGATADEITPAVIKIVEDVINAWEKLLTQLKAKESVK